MFHCCDDAKRTVGWQILGLMSVTPLLVISLSVYLFAVGAISVYGGRKLLGSIRRIDAADANTAPRSLREARLLVWTYLILALLLSGSWLVVIPYGVYRVGKDLGFALPIP